MSVLRDAMLAVLRENEEAQRRARGAFGSPIGEIDYEPEGEDAIIASNILLGRTRLTIKVERITDA